MNPSGLLAAVSGAFVFIAVQRALRGTSFRRRLVAFGLFSLLALPALSFSLCYLPGFPQAAWYYEMRSWRGIEFAMLFAGGAGGAATAILSRHRLVPVMAYGFLALAPYIKPLIAPIPESRIRTRRLDDVCLQGSPTTCGPASVVTILWKSGIAATEVEAARAAYSSSRGTEAWYLARYVRSKGLPARFEFRDTFAPEAGLPAMVGVKLGTIGHFIAVLAVKDDRVTFVDPLTGEETVSMAEFRRRYRFSGFHLVIGARIKG